MTDQSRDVLPIPGAARNPRVGPSVGWRGRIARQPTTKAYVLLSPTLMLLIGVMCVPVGMLIAYSFWTQNYLEIDTTFTLANYVSVLSKKIYPIILWRSIVISLSVTVATIVMAYPIAYFIAFRVRRHKMIWLILITVPFWTSYLLRVFAWKVILGYNGVINSALIWLGVVDAPLEFLLYNPIAVVITLAHAWAPVAILPIFVSLEKIDRSLLEAATDLGDTPFERFFRVTLPLTVPGIVAAFLLVFIPTVGDYVTPQLVGGPDGMMIGNLMYTLFFRVNNWPMGSALSIITIVTITAVGFTIWRLTRRARGKAQ
jgi:spermidine/putrescine transport system permease protein